MHARIERFYPVFLVASPHPSLCLPFSSFPQGSESCSPRKNAGVRNARSAFHEKASLCEPLDCAGGLQSASGVTSLDVTLPRVLLGYGSRR